MKKVIISILSLAMTAYMAVPAFADNTADVQGKYKAGAESPVTIFADITWEDMTFNYTEGEKTWNPETHQVDQADGKWNSDTKAITVTNHSNVGIMAKFAFAPNGEIEGSFTKDSTPTDQLALDTIKNLEEGSAAPSDTMNFGITNGTISENGKLGTITVYIAPNDGNNYVFMETELTEAAEKGGSFKLANDLYINDRIIISKGNFEIDLNGKSINCSDGFNLKDVTHKISNGTINSTGSNECLMSSYYGNTIVDNCTLTANDYYAVYVCLGSTATVKDSTLTGLSYSYGAAIADGENAVLTFVGSNIINGNVKVRGGGKVVFSGNVTLNGGIDKSDENSTVVCEAGTYNFDPTDYVDSEKFDITKDGSIWTVTAK